MYERAATDNDIVAIARYLIDNNETVRKAGEHFGLSKSAIHRYMRVELKDIDPDAYDEICSLFNLHKIERTIKGGLATKEKWLRAKKDK